MVGTILVYVINAFLGCLQSITCLLTLPSCLFSWYAHAAPLHLCLPPSGRHLLQPLSCLAMQQVQAGNWNLPHWGLQYIATWLTAGIAAMLHYSVGYYENWDGGRPYCRAATGVDYFQISLAAISQECGHVLHQQWPEQVDGQIQGRRNYA